MEEDIKILKGMLGFISVLNTEQRQALENLIKGYRELEKDLHEMTISNNHKKENWIHKNCLNDYIPKSKIKEKIEELEKQLDKYKEMYAVSIADRVNSAFKQEHKNNEDLEMLYKGCQIELEKKDAIIDLMAKELAKLNYIQYCNEKNCNYPPCNKESCIKKYFKEKVEDK